MNKYFLCLLALLVTLSSAMSGCATESNEPETGPTTVNIVATQDFGNKLMFDKVLEVTSGTSAMAALQMAAEVEMEYGGGFVNAIDGVKSDFGSNAAGQNDWFVYINGILSNAGALEYELSDGDIVHWDYRDWGHRQFIPAIIGSFPEPFNHGYAGKTRPNIIAFSDGFSKDAENLADSLAKNGIGNISAISYRDLSADNKGASNLFLLGKMDDDFIRELNKAWKRLGFFAYFQDGNLVTVNSKNEVDATYGSVTGIVQATQNPWNPKGIGACENVVWMISGTSGDGIRNAIDVLMKRSSELQYAYAVIIHGDNIIRIPQE